MAKNICPNCHEVILSLGGEQFLECLKCLAIFKIINCDEDRKEEEK